MVPNQYVLHPSRQRCPDTAVTIPLEAQLVPATFWPLAGWGQRAPEAKISPGCPGRGQRKQAVLQGNVSGRTQGGRPRLKAKLWPSV